MDPKVAHTAKNNSEAEIIKSWLEQQGIKATVFNGEMNSGAFEIIESDPQVVVNADDYDRAIEVIAEFKNELEQMPDMSNVSDAEGQFDWPMCPVCDEMRLARCEKCDHIGSEFSTEESDEANQLICLECNEKTTIEFVVHCKFCEHDFTGSTPDNISIAETSMESANKNRVLLLVTGMIILFVALAIWFIITTQ